MNPTSFTRRDALKTAALGALALPLLGSVASAAEKKKGEKAAPAPAAALPSYTTYPEGRENGLRLGVTSYSTRTLTLDETIATMKIVRISNLALFKAHCNWEGGTVDECRAIGDKLKAAGLRLTGSGVINLPNDEKKCRQAFENVKAAGMATMVCKPAKDAFALVEKLTKEFDQKLAIHNHGPEDKEYPSPAVAYEAIKSLDARIGLCIDVGHTARFGEDPITSIKKYASRVYDVHLKDSVAVATPSPPTC